ncbi:hypothetical protein GY45DRAFT_1324972 [Cubamyces sp. BRFM 1775]|nr:hypothetical protein GY45DRAFT_1324972 [Cubamyces sp. BRFM 1775]
MNDDKNRNVRANVPAAGHPTGPTYSHRTHIAPARTLLPRPPSPMIGRVGPSSRYGMSAWTIRTQVRSDDSSLSAVLPLPRVHGRCLLSSGWRRSPCA